jgi:N-acyl-D-aspartate/D-glutamate deacylase
VFDVLIAGGDVYDGSGAGPVPADVGVRGDRVVAVGHDLPREAGAVIDATGQAVCPGFVNILSHSHLSILHDPRSLGELTQGVTTEVFGEGTSMGPPTAQLRAELEHAGRGLAVEVSWTRLSEYLRHVERRGASQNVASFIGAGTLRAGVVGYSDRPATPAELDRMREIAAEEMADGALGIASALVYPPGSYAPTSELVSLAEVAAAYDGCYASHVRGAPSPGRGHAGKRERGIPYPPPVPLCDDGQPDFSSGRSARAAAPSAGRRPRRPRRRGARAGPDRQPGRRCAPRGDPHGGGGPQRRLPALRRP